MARLPTKAVLLACVTSVSVWFRIFREAKTENPYLGLSLLRNRKEKLATQARVEQTLYKVRVRTDETQYNRSRTQWMYWWNSVERSIGFLYCYYKLRQKIQTTVMIRLSAWPSRAHLLLVLCIKGRRLFETGRLFGTRHISFWETIEYSKQSFNTY